MFETWYKMIAMLQSGLNVDTVITHPFDFSHDEKAFDTMASRQSGKIIINF